MLKSATLYGYTSPQLARELIVNENAFFNTHFSVKRVVPINLIAESIK